MNASKIAKLLVFIGFFSILFWVIQGKKPEQSAPSNIAFRESTLYIRTEDGEKTIQIEVAETREQMSQGLMFRSELPKGRGMLFLFPQEQIGEMWMKNTFIPLDMVFVDKMKKIVCIAENTTPQSTDIIRCDKPIVAVLELPGGYTSANGITLGQTVMYHVPPSTRK